MKTILLSLLFLLAGCGHRHMYFDASEFNQNVESHKPSWKQILSKEMPDDYNLIIDSYFDSVHTLFPPLSSEKKDPDIVYIYAPIQDKIFDLEKTGFYEIMLGEGNRGGAAIYKFKIWSPNLEWIIWEKYYDNRILTYTKSPYQ
jgi:hypothetical protein